MPWYHCADHGFLWLPLGIRISRVLFPMLAPGVYQLIMNVLCILLGVACNILLMPLLFMLHMHWVWWMLAWLVLRSAFIVKQLSPFVWGDIAIFESCWCVMLSNVCACVWWIFKCVCRCCICVFVYVLKHSIGFTYVSQSSTSSCTSTSRPSSCIMCLSELLSSHIADCVVMGLSDCVFSMSVFSQGQLPGLLLRVCVSVCVGVVLLAIVCGHCMLCCYVVR